MAAFGRSPLPVPRDVAPRNWSISFPPPRRCNSWTTSTSARRSTYLTGIKYLVHPIGPRHSSRFVATFFFRAFLSIEVYGASNPTSASLLHIVRLLSWMKKLRPVGLVNVVMPRLLLQGADQFTGPVPPYEAVPQPNYSTPPPRYVAHYTLIYWE